MRAVLRFARIFLVVTAITAALASLGACHTFTTDDGGTFTAFGMPWGLVGEHPASWLTQNLGEVIVGATVALTGGHVIMARRRPKGAFGPTRTVRRAPEGRKRH